MSNERFIEELIKHKPFIMFQANSVYFFFIFKWKIKNSGPKQ